MVGIVEVAQLIVAIRIGDGHIPDPARPEAEIASLIVIIGLILCIPVALAIGPVILRAACYLCEVEVPAFVRAFWVSLLTWFLCPVVARVVSWVTGFAGSYFDRGIFLSIDLSQPRGQIAGGPFIGNAFLLAVSWITGADIKFPPGSLFSGSDILSEGPIRGHADISVLGTFLNLNIVMLLSMIIYNRYLGLTLWSSVVVWLVDLVLKMEIIGFIMVMIYAVIVFTQGVG